MGRNRKSARTIIPPVTPSASLEPWQLIPWSDAWRQTPLVTFENAIELYEQGKLGKALGWGFREEQLQAYNTDREAVRKVVQTQPENIDAWLDALPFIPEIVTLRDVNALSVICGHEVSKLLPIALYGNAEQRRRAIERFVALREIDRALPRELRDRRYYENGLNEIWDISSTLDNSSIESLWYTSKRENSSDIDVDLFLKRFWDKWAVEPMTQMGFAQMHHYLSRVGPNAEYPPTLDFYPYPDVPPGLNPQIIAALNGQYQRTQAALKQSHPSGSVNLMRGTSMRTGLALESWTTDERTAEAFSRGLFSESRPGGGGDFRDETIPNRFIMSTYQTIPTWNENAVRGKQEYMVLGTAFYQRKGGDRQQAGRRWHNPRRGEG